MIKSKIQRFYNMVLDFNMLSWEFYGYTPGKAIYEFIQNVFILGQYRYTGYLRCWIIQDCQAFKSNETKMCRFQYQSGIDNPSCSKTLLSKLFKLTKQVGFYQNAKIYFFLHLSYP